MHTGKSDLVDIDGEVHAETEKAILFYNGSNKAWLPKSMIEVEDISHDMLKEVRITIPSWFAHQKGLI